MMGGSLGRYGAGRKGEALRPILAIFDSVRR
jgi:hypothetical protein